MKKRIISTLLSTLLFVSAIPLSSCGGTAKPPKSKVDHVYKAKTIEVDENVNLTSLFTTGDSVNLLASEVIDQEHYTAQKILLSYDLEGNKTGKTILDQSEDSNIYTQSVISGANGELILLRRKYDEETNRNSYLVEKQEGDGYVLLCSDVCALLNDSTKNFYPNNFVVDANGNFCLASSSLIVVFDKDFKKLFEIEQQSVRLIGKTNDGRLFVSYTDDKTYETVLKYIDLEKKAIGDDVPTPEFESRNIKFYTGPGYDLYYKDELSFYGYNAGGEPVELMNFVNSDVNPTSVQNISIIDADNLVLHTRDTWGDSWNESILLMKRIPEDEIPEKYVIRLAGCPDGSGGIESNIVKFNRASDEYRVELINYSGSDANERLEREILDGTAPDIISLTYSTNANNWIEQGVFTDLNKLIEKDENFDRSKFFASVLDACTDEKGRMYQFITEFSLGTIAANSKYVDFDSWNAEKYIDFATNLPEGTYLVDYIDRQSALYYGIACSMDSFIDYDKATCSFDGELFKRLLEFAKSVPEETISYYSTLEGDDLEDFKNDPAKPYREGKILTVGQYIYQFRSYIQATVQFGEDDKVVFVGYPTNHGNGTLLQPATSYGINDKSLVKDGAWEFIKLVADSSTVRATRMFNFPTNIQMFDAAIDEEIGDWYFMTYNGTSSYGKDMTYEEVMERVKKNAERFGDNITGGVVVQVSEEHREGLKAMIEGAQLLPDLEGKIFTMINEEAEMYFSDAKTLDETVKIIQDRVSTYIAEKK